MFCYRLILKLLFIVYTVQAIPKIKHVDKFTFRIFVKLIGFFTEPTVVFLGYYSADRCALRLAQGAVEPTVVL